MEFRITGSKKVGTGRTVNLLLKRVFDILVAIVGLVVSAPVMAMVATAILVDLGRPVLFIQKRIGKDERPFQVYKFRTMRSVSDAKGRSLPDEQRVTQVGRLLRKLSLDELPQLWNVLRGDMSLVGPRPLLVEYVPYYSPRERRRHEMRPGITGYAQISGRNRLTWSERLELDVQYVEQFSLWLDVQILWRTVWKVLAREDVLDVPSAAGQRRLDVERGARPQL